MKEWVPKEIKEFREKHGLYQKDLSNLLGVSTNYVYLLEKGVKQPSKTLKLLLDYVEADFNARGKEELKRGKRNL